jgi:drug/metabolite transporter (DMT)-like permease
MVAFAANSLLCRLALADGSIDPYSFTTVRVLTAAMTLALIGSLRRRPKISPVVQPRAIVAIVIYMLCFSFAYQSLAAGTGALVLFGAVQLTMFLVAIRSGERFTATAWLGFAFALGGLIYLVLPGLEAPDPFAAVIMGGAGVGWGIYSLTGRGVKDPLTVTAKNFLWTLPFVALASLLKWDAVHLSSRGLLFSALSGAVASGGGYVVWFAALRGLAASRAATVQLSVPLIAAFGGVLFLSEPLTLRLGLASLSTLGGIALFLRRA